MSVPQMTPYGIYNITYKYSARRAEAREKAAPATGYGRAYSSLSFLRAFQGLFAERLTSQKNEYRKQIVDVMTSVQTLTDAAEDFLSDGWPGFKLSAEAGVKGEALPAARQNEYQIEVRQLAEKHTYKSRAIAAGERDILPAGSYDLEIITKNGREKAVFDVRAKDTARFTMARVADAVTAFSKSVTMKVMQEDNFVHLAAIARTGGEDGIFQITSAAGGWLEDLGLTVTRAGRDGMVIVDGVGYKTTDNKLELDAGRLKLSFSQTGKSGVSVLPDKEGAVLSMEFLAEAYNNFRQTLKIAGNTDKSVRLLNAAGNIFGGSLKDDFRAIGLSMDEGGALVFSRETAARAADAQLAKMRDLGKGAAFAFYNMANSVQRSPVSYYFMPTEDSSQAAQTLKNLPDKWQGIFVDIAA